MIEDMGHEEFVSPNEHTSPMYSVTDSPAGSGNSTISYDLHVTSTQSTNATFWIFISNERNKVWFDVKSHLCSTVRPVEIAADHSSYLVAGKQQHVSGSYNVTKSGIYYLYFVLCDGADDSLTLEGTCSWENPYGYLPGDVYLKLPMSGVFTLLYLVIFFVYMALCIVYRSVLFKLQYGILFVIFVEVLESAAWYFYRLSNNNSGHYSITSLFVVVFIANLRKTFVHVLVLLLSMGIGIVKWTIGTARAKLVVLTIFYLFFASACQFVVELDAVKKTAVIQSLPARALVIVPLYLLSACFYYWTLLSIIRTMQQLTLRRQVLKLQSYKFLFAVLVITAILVASGFLFKTYTERSNNKAVKHNPDTWRYTWLEEAYTESLFFFVLVSVAFMWRPRANNSRYGYAEFFTDDENARSADEDNSVQLETLTVVGGGELSRRTASVNSGAEYSNDREKNIAASMPSLTEFEKDIMAFDLSDDSEEVSVQTQIKKLD